MRSVFLPFGLLAAALLSGSRPRPANCPFVVQGVVTYLGRGLAQAYVSLDSSRIGATTDSAGRYRFVIPCPRASGAASLLIRSIGFTQLRRPVVLDDRNVPITMNIDFTQQSLMAVGIMGTVVTDAELPGRTPRYGTWQRRLRSARLDGPFDHQSSAIVRQFLWDNELPPMDSFSLEGLIESVPLRWPASAGDSNVALAVDEIPVPWLPEHRLVRASLIARPAERVGAPRNIVMVVDASSMLWHQVPRVRDALSSIVPALNARDRLSIVLFNGPRGALATAISGAEHARIRAALDSLNAGPSETESDVLAIAARTARQGAGAGRETRIVVVTDVDAGLKDLGATDLAASATTLRREGIHVDVMHLENEDGTPLMSAVTQAGDGLMLSANKDVQLYASLAKVFGVSLPTYARDPSFSIRFDERRVASWRCLNDIGGSPVDTARSRHNERLYAGMSLSVLCEVEPREGVSAPTRAQVSVVFRDARDNRKTLHAEAAPDSSLHDDSRILADMAAFGLALQNRKDVGNWNLDSIVVDLERRRARTDGVVTSLSRLVRHASWLRRR